MAGFDEKQKKGRTRTRRVRQEKTMTDVGQYFFVTQRNVNKSSAQYDVLRDMARIQSNVGTYEKSQIWKNMVFADEVGWRLFRA